MPFNLGDIATVSVELGPNAEKRLDQLQLAIMALAIVVAVSLVVAAFK